MPGSNLDLKRTLYVRVKEAGTRITHRFICSFVGFFVCSTFIIVIFGSLEMKLFHIMALIKRQTYNNSKICPGPWHWYYMYYKGYLLKKHSRS